VIFSLEKIVVRRSNLDKLPHWLAMIPPMKEEWASEIQTSEGGNAELICVDRSRVADLADMTFAATPYS
jgi:hypothetical protein